MKPFIPIVWSLLAFLAQPATAQQKPPTAPVRPVTDEYFGQKITDPYRWMEDMKSDEMQQWMRAQANYSRALLDRLPMRITLQKRLESLNAALTRVGGVKRVGDRLYYFRRTPTDQIRNLMMRGVAAGSPDRMLIDLNKLSADRGKNYQIGAYVPSPDGKLLAYELYEGGKEIGETRVIEIATGRDTGIIIGNGAKPQGWLPDSRAFTYTRIEDGMKPEERDYKRRIRLHTLGSDAKNDRELFGYRVNSDLDFPVVTDYAVTIPPGSKWAFGWVNPGGVTTNYELYYAPVDALSKFPIPWRKIAGITDEVAPSAYREFELALRGDALYVITTKNEPLGKVIRLDLNRPDVAKAETIFKSDRGAITNLRAANDALYVHTTEGGAARLWHVDYQTQKQLLVPVPAGGSVYGLNGDAQHDGLIFGTDSFVKTEAFLRYDPTTSALIDTQLARQSALNTFGIEVVTVQAKSHDGVMVPIIIVHKKGLKLDGTNPTLLRGYGAYGTNGLDPMFNLANVVWVEHGGILVMTGVRGGGEYGEAWRLGGFQATKPNTWKDFIACAEHLIAKGYTAPAHLGGQGGSAGGVLINNAVVERPDLFGAALVNVGASNMLRFETTANGAGNLPEFGSVATEAGFKALLAMDAYHKVKPGVKYPAMLFIHGANDPRVEPWLSAKMAARLQAATTSGKPVLLRINYDSGHSGGSTVKQTIELSADTLAFLFQQLGGKP